MWSVIIFILVGLPDQVLVEMGCYEEGGKAILKKNCRNADLKNSNEYNDKKPIKSMTVIVGLSRNCRCTLKKSLRK